MRQDQSHGAAAMGSPSDSQGRGDSLDYWAVAGSMGPCEILFSRRNAMPEISPLAGKPADPSVLVNVARLVTSYYTGQPDPAVAAQRVAFGTSGHRGSSLDNSFNEGHILAI